MQSLHALISRLRVDLPAADEIDVDSLYDLHWDIEAVIGANTRVLSLDDGNAENLDPELKAFFDALRYIQCINALYNDISHDGFLSIFYNRTGAELDLLRSELRNFADPIAPLVEISYRHLAPIYGFVADTNYVTRSGSTLVVEAVPERIMQAIEALEEQIEDLRDASFDRCLSMYRASARNASCSI
jgi:hypothetical protein